MRAPRDLVIGSTPATSTVRSSVRAGLIAAWPLALLLAAMGYTAVDIERAHKAHRIASLIGVEGGHQISNSLLCCAPTTTPARAT